MPATALDPKTALVVIDLQNGLASHPLVHPFQTLVANSAKLAEAFRAANLPVILVTVGHSLDGGDAVPTRTDRPRSPAITDPALAELVPELGAKPEDLRIVKRQANAFYGTELDLQLRRRGITQIVLTGVSTSNGVLSTARGAHEHAYNVTFVLDAMSDPDAGAHEFVITKMFPRLGESDTTDAVLALLAKRKH